MAMLQDEDRAKVEEFFQAIEHPVKLVVFTQSTECEYCTMTRELVGELAGLSDQLTVELHNLEEDEAAAQEYGIDKAPAIALVGDKDYGIRFFGVPAGYEFTSLIEGIVDVGKRDHGLPDDIVRKLEQVDRPIHMQAMVTPTCPYCPRAVRTAHKFAMVSDYIRGDMVEVTEFPDLAAKYSIQGVPNTIINETESVLGAQPEKDFVKAVLKAAGK
jgi:glutaredoxin-like protein